MRRTALVALVLLTLGGCASGGGGSARSYGGPEEMASAAGASSCGKVDEAAAYDGAHYVICEVGGRKVQFVAGDSEGAAEGAARAMEALGWVVEQRGLWAVGADDQETLDAAVSALS